MTLFHRPAFSVRRNTFFISAAAILLILFGFWAYKSHLIAYLEICSHGQSNLVHHVNEFRRFRYLPEKNYYLYIDVRDPDSAKITLYNREEDPNAAHERIPRKISPDSLVEYCSLDSDGNMRMKNDSGIAVIDNWFVSQKSTHGFSPGIADFFKLDFDRIVHDLRETNCCFLSGKRDDLTLVFNERINMQAGCMTGDWYSYHYHFGDKRILDREHVSYTELTKDIQYGWW